MITLAFEKFDIFCLLVCQSNDSKGANNHFLFLYKIPTLAQEYVENRQVIMIIELTYSRSKCTAKMVVFPILSYPAGIYLFKVNNENTRTMCKICSKLTIKTLELLQ